VASQLGQASFPSDFPDTQSGWEYDLLRGTDDAAERKLRPTGLYPSSFAVDWHLVGKGDHPPHTKFRQSEQSYFPRCFLIGGDNVVFNGDEFVRNGDNIQAPPSPAEKPVSQRATAKIPNPGPFR